MTWLTALWRAVVAWLAYRSGAQAGTAEAQQTQQLAAAQEAAHEAEAIEGAWIGTPRDRAGTRRVLNEGEF